jgi:hypothetical protein
MELEIDLIEGLRDKIQSWCWFLNEENNKLKK